MNKIIRFSVLSQLLRCFSKGAFSEALQNQFCHCFCTVNQNNTAHSSNNSNNQNLSGENMKKECHNSPPEPPDPDECCEDGCANCVWLNYVTEVKFHYKNNDKKLKEAFELIPSIEHREFVKFSLKELEENRTSST